MIIQLQQLNYETKTLKQQRVYVCVERQRRRERASHLLEDGTEC